MMHSHLGDLDKKVHLFRVLILVVMDDALAHMTAVESCWILIVLILVVMDDALAPG